MTATLSRRLGKLESLTKASGGIPVWCDDPGDVPTAVTAMIECGEIAESDRPHCVYWADTPAGCMALSHEDALAQLERET